MRVTLISISTLTRWEALKTTYKCTNGDFIIFLEIVTPDGEALNICNLTHRSKDLPDRKYEDQHYKPDQLESVALKFAEQQGLTLVKK